MTAEKVTEKGEFWRAVWNRKMLICVFTGFTSGLPLYILFSLIPAWLREEGIDLHTIGLFALTTMPYTFKFLWAPLADWYIPPFLGLRRGWMIIMQVLLLVCVAALGIFNPHQTIVMIALVNFLIALFSATQDVSIDAFRREILADNQLGLGNSIHVNAYRVSALIPGSLGLYLADHIPWPSVFQVIAMFMCVGIAMSLVVSEPDVTGKPRTLGEAVIEPFKEFIGRKGWKSAIMVVVFMFLYKIGDNMATALSTPFYLDMGFTNTQIAVIGKNAALWPSIIGGMLGGLLMVKIGINRGLWLFGFAQLITILGFAVLSLVGTNLYVFAVVIALEYLGVGLGTAAFVAFIARSTNPRFAATQLALFTALASLPRTFANASVGYIVETIGWTHFFVFCAIIAIPGMLLLFKVAPWNGEEKVI